jgi:hypothetical protein
MQARFFAGDHAAALDASSRARRLLWTTDQCFEAAEYYFYGAMSCAAACYSATDDERQQHLEALGTHHEHLRVWAERCPENFENRAALVGAEIARIEGRVLDAIDLYERAIRSARTNGFLHNEALANELAARFYAARGFSRSRISTCEMPGAATRVGELMARCANLTRCIPICKEEESESTRRVARSARRSTSGPATVLKVSQAVSGEIVVEKLVETLLRTAIEHAGAQRGC